MAAVFWGDYPSLTARKYLRNTLYRLRIMLDSVGADSSQYLNITEDNVAFIITSPHWLDVECFETITSHYHQYKAEDLLSEQAAELRNCIDIYTGDLLESVYEDWCLHDRERLRLAYLDSLGKLMMYSASQADYTQGIEYGERVVLLDPTRENVHRQLMVLHWMDGDHYSALAQYKGCAQILQEEMGIQPMEETQLLFDKMTHNIFEPALSAGKGKNHARDIESSPSSGHDLELILSCLSRLQDNARQPTNEIQRLQGLINQTLPKEEQ